MKKLFIVILAALVAFSATGCTGTAKPSFDDKKPWQSIVGYSNRETTTYSIKKYAHKNAEKIEIADGTLRLALRDGTSELVGQASVAMSASLSFNGDDINGSSKNLTDTAESTVTFYNSSLSPLRSEKKVTQAVRPGSTVNHSYTVTADYTENKSVITKSGKEPQEKKIKGTDLFDNEQMYYVVRSLFNLKTGTTSSLTFLNAYDLFLGHNNRKMTIAVDSKLALLDVNQTVYDAAKARRNQENEIDEENPGKKTEDGKYYLDSLYVQMVLAATKSGPAIDLYYSDLVMSVNGEEKTKVLLKIIEREYTDTGTLVFSTEYILSNITA